MIPDEPSRPAAIPRHEVYHMVAAELVHEPTRRGISSQRAEVSVGIASRKATHPTLNGPDGILQTSFTR